MADSLKKKTGIALFWSFIDKGAQQLIQLIILYIMARVVDIDEFGTVATLSIFIVIANILQDSGFSSALIRKKEVSQAEYSSVFFFNITLGCAIYLILFFCAPLLSNIYDKPELTNLSRVIFLSFVFNSFAFVQNIILIRRMDFKSNTQISIIASIVSGIIAIVMAMKGYGAWSLVAQAVLLTFIRNILLWLFIRWTPSAQFSGSLLRSMIPYSSKLTASGILNQVCDNIYTNVIAKCFSLHAAGLYNNAKKFNTISQSVISDGIKGAVFPMLAKVNDDPVRQKRAFRKVVNMTSFISFPASMLLILLSGLIISSVLSDKWIDAIPLLKIIAAGAIFYPIRVLISPLLQATGKSGLILKLDLARNILILLAIPISIQWGITGLVWGIGIANISFFFIEMSIACRHIRYSFKEILSDIMPYLLISAVSFLPLLYLDRYLDAHLYVISAIQIVGGGCIYLLIVKLIDSTIIRECIIFFKSFFKTKFQ